VAERIISSKGKADETALETSLRPRKLDDYVGQGKTKENLKIAIDAAKKRDEALDHILLYGPPGLGKTTLANIVAAEMGVNIRITAGPAIERPGDMAAILTNLKARDILFIDEIHRLGRGIEEVLYPAMEDFALDIVIGKGPTARSIRLKIPKFTLIGATTRYAMMSAPLRDRFGSVYRLDFYTAGDLEAILGRSAKILNVPIDSAAIKEVAKRSRGTPRVANRLLRRVRDFGEVVTKGRVTQPVAVEALSRLEVDELGLDKMDHQVLRAVIEKFGGGPVGLETIATSIAEEADTIMDVYEPFLMQLGFLGRTPRGRVATKRAYDYLKIPYPQKNGPDPLQPSLLAE
jgi:Holliday junction DNA helicase RuvB